MIKDQLSGRLVKAHSDQIRLAPIDEWIITDSATGKRKRRTAYVASPDSSDSDESEDNNQKPLIKLVKRRRQERYSSSVEDDILLMELSKRLKANKTETKNYISSNPTSLQKKQ